MRSVIAWTVAAIAAATVGAMPAQAAQWNCNGPNYVCEGGKTAKATKSKSSAKANKATKSAKLKRNKAKVAAKSYSGSGGKASYYWQPQRVASGGWFNPNAMTAAHKTLPFGTKVRVTNKNNGKSVVVTINDRGPYIAGRVIDLSRAAAYKISMQGAGVVPVALQIMGRG
jgi:rare lipoprotein A